MRVTHLRKASIWNYLSDFTYPSFFSNPLSEHAYQKQIKNTFFFVQEILRENKQKALYRQLEEWYQTSHLDFKKQIEKGFLLPSLHPLEEQEWFQHYFESKIHHFSPQELWEIIFSYGKRETYAQYLKTAQETDGFELFIHHYLIQALPGSILKEIFFIAMDALKVDQKMHLKQLFDCLHFKQGKLLLEALKQEKMPLKNWKEICKNILEVMRNAQIKEVISLIPSELEQEALKKLYPSEVLEIVDQEQDEKKKRYLIDKILENHKTWWRSFPREEVREVCAHLTAKIV